MDINPPKENLVIGRSSQGFEIRAAVLRLTQHHVAFEILDPALVLQTSEVLNEIKILLNDRSVYSGRAVISNVVNTGL